MKWQLSGTYASACTCTSESHWPIDGTMSDSNGACKSVAVFKVDGNFSELNLNGISFAFYNFFPERLSEGEWVTGLVVGSDASDDQAQSIERIFTGRSGGPFSVFSGLVGEYLGMDVAHVDLVIGERTSASVTGRTTFRFEPLLQADGSPVPARNGMFAFGNDVKVGHSVGKSTAYGYPFETRHGEVATFSFTDETLAMESGFPVRR